MKDNKILLLAVANIIPLALAIAAIYMAIHEIWGWGWLLAASILTVHTLESRTEHGEDK